MSAEQTRLFDPGPTYDGPLSVRQFMGQAQWHATHEYPRWADDVRAAGVPIHSGTPQAATETNASFGARYPVRPRNVTSDVFTDAEVNKGDATYRAESGLPVSDSVSESASIGRASATGVRDAADALARGQSVRYTNAHEDKGSTSFVSPAGSFETLRDTTDFHEVPNAREYLLPQEARAQGMPVYDPHEDRTNRPSADPRLLEGVEGDRVGEERWIPGEEVQSLPDADLRGLASRTSAGNIRPAVVAEGRLGELFKGMRTL